jgi:hypothetical protein
MYKFAFCQAESQHEEENYENRFARSGAAASAVHAEFHIV